LKPPFEAIEEEDILISPKTVITSFSTTPSLTTPSFLLLKTFMKFYVTMKDGRRIKKNRPGPDG